MVNILAPTPKIYPSAAVNIGHTICKNIYIKSAVWYNQKKCYLQTNVYSTGRNKMERKISEYVSFYQKYSPIELSMVNPKDYSKISNEKLNAILFDDNPKKIRIKDNWYDILSYSRAVRTISEVDKGYHFLYIQINWKTNEYYIGKMNRKRWSEIRRYQGSGIRFKQKYKIHQNEFSRFIFAYGQTNEETERIEADIIDNVLLNDPKCLNLVCGGGGTSEHSDNEERKERIRSHMKSHPEQYDAMLQKAKELYHSGQTSALKIRAQSIKNTMSDEKYSNMFRERILQWRNKNPEEYEKAREKNRIAARSEESRLKRKVSREKWIAEHPEEHKLYQQKLIAARTTPEAIEKRKASLKLWRESHPEEAKEKDRKRAAASAEKNSKRVNMCNLETGEIIKTFNSQAEAAQWLVDQGIAKNTNCKSSISQVCLHKPCTTGYGVRKKAYGFGWKFAD